MIYINFLAVLVAAVVHMSLGALWFSPLLFGKQWLSVSNVTPEMMAASKAKGGMWKSYLVAFIASLAMAYVLAHFIFFVGATSVLEGFQIGFWTVLGFIAPVLLSGVLWEGRPRKWFWINALYYLVSLLIMGAILALW